jgi:hypothetical protein
MEMKKYLREKNVDEEYELKQAYLRKHRRLRTGPPYLKIGRMILYEREALERWIGQHAVNPKKQNIQSKSDLVDDTTKSMTGGRDE